MGREIERISQEISAMLSEGKTPREIRSLLIRRHPARQVDYAFRDLNPGSFHGSKKKPCKKTPFISKKMSVMSAMFILFIIAIYWFTSYGWGR